MQNRKVVRRLLTGLVGRLEPADPSADPPAISLVPEGLVPAARPEPAPPKSAVPRRMIKVRESECCVKHRVLLPCFACDAEFVQVFHKTPEQYSESFHQLLSFEQNLKSKRQTAATNKDSKSCPHSIYSPEYCSICTIHRVDPDYDTEVYRKEINKALADLDVRKKDRDLIQIIDIEIWKASVKYKDKMSGALAYTIADRKKNSFLKALLEEQGRLVSYDQTAEDEEGETYNPVENEIARKELSGPRPEPQIHDADILEICKPDLEDLIRNWHGVKRTVAEAMLQDPQFNVRSLSGLNKNVVGRVRKGILVEFRKRIQEAKSAA